MRKISLIALVMLVLSACSLFSPTAVPDQAVDILDVPTATPRPTMTPTAVPTATAIPTVPDTEEPQESEQKPVEEPSPKTASGLPDASDYHWVETASGFSAPVYLTGAGDGSGRLFVVSQRGQIYVLRDGQVLGEPFLDISDRTSRPLPRLGERGLLGLAFHPNYAENGFFYVNYTDREGDTHIARFSVSSADPDKADPGSERTVLFVGQPYGNHNGGGLVFGPDGYLYIALGDGGSGGDPLGNGQSVNTYLGKILRIDIDADEPYGIPADNPFADGGGLAEIWAYGLRNPWRIAFDRQTGDLFIADVGQNAYEEVNFQPASAPGGENYGWDYREGAHAFEGRPPADLRLIEPAAEYEHALGCSVTGGEVYRGMDLPDWQGVYLYGDYCSGRIWGLFASQDGAWQNELLFETGFTISSFGLDDEGELYVVDYSGGVVYRLGNR